MPELENGYIIEFDTYDILNIYDAKEKFPNHRIFMYNSKSINGTRLFIFADSKKSAVQHVLAVYGVVKITEDDLKYGE